MTKKSPAELYEEREKRVSDAIQLKTPDRVPVAPVDTGFFVKYAGIPWAQAMYDAEKLKAASKKTITEFNFDAFFPPAVYLPGQVYDKLNFKELKWAGATLESNRVSRDSIYQFVEPGSGYEAMPAEDYDWFLDDPSDYVLRRHWPRIAKTLEPFKTLPPIRTMVSYVLGFGQFLPVFGSMEIQAAFEALMGAGKEALKFSESMMPFIQEIVGLGFPPLCLAVCYAPFDYLADFLRGTRGCMLDMYRNPDKLKKATERVTPWMIDWGLSQAKAFSKFTKIIFIPIHKAAGDLMSEEQHKEFFWPSLRKLMIAIIEEGFIPYVYTEGRYTERLATIKDIPRGKVIYHIESDIFKAKEILGDTTCLSGGPLGSMLDIGTPQEVRNYCKKLIDVVGEGGGFIMDVELPLLSAKPENVKAMVEFTQEYGVYR